MPRVELLFFDGCPNHQALEPQLRALLRRRRPDSELQLLNVESDEEARRVRFLGSPTVRVDGRDVERGAEDRSDFVLSCRLYRTEHGLAGRPDERWVRAALSSGEP